MLKRGGFTLIGLLVTFVVLGIVASIAIPSFSQWLPNYRLRAATRDIVSAMQLARLQAVKENDRVVTLFNLLNNSYVSFVDNGAGGGTPHNWTRDGSERVLVNKTLPEGVSWNDVAFAGTQPQDFQRTGFNSRGFPIYLGHIHLQNVKGRFMGVKVGAGGNPRIETSQDGTTWH